jgi:Luciferase
MENLEREALSLLGVQLSIHRFGGIEFLKENGRELGHLHGHGLLDVLVGRERAKILIANGRVRRHHVLPDSGWVSFQIESAADLPFALELLMAQSAR